MQTLKQFRHWVLEVFVNDKEGNQLMLLGRILADYKDGSQLDKRFSARVEFDGSGSETKLKFFQGWSSTV